jgi:glutamate racemase
MPSSDPIGLFDSGIGGLTVLHEIIAKLPRENTVYLGDTARSPYGTKSVETVLRYSFENADFLLQKRVKLVVVACNTSTAVALGPLQSELAVPVVGVIEPGARGALKKTRNKRIGVIGTEATIQSGAYTEALKRLDRNVEVYSRACPLFVPLVEEGWLDNEVVDRTVEAYLAGFKRSGMGRDVRLVDSAEETAEEVSRSLKEKSLEREKGKGAASFFVTDMPDRFIKVGRRFMGERVDGAVRIER